VVREKESGNWELREQLAGGSIEVNRTYRLGVCAPTEPRQVVEGHGLYTVGLRGGSRVSNSLTRAERDFTKLAEESEVRRYPMQKLCHVQESFTKSNMLIRNQRKKVPVII
jgi:hypothetical protein